MSFCPCLFAFGRHVFFELPGAWEAPRPRAAFQVDTLGCERRVQRPPCCAQWRPGEPPEDTAHCCVHPIRGEDVPECLNKISFPLKCGTGGQRCFRAGRSCLAKVFCGEHVTLKIGFPDS